MKSLFPMVDGIGMVAVLCVMVSVFYGIGGFATALFVTVGWFFYGKLVLAMAFYQGYGVRKGVTIVLGMPLSLLGFVSLVVGIIALLLVTAYQNTSLMPETLANIRAVGWSAAIGQVMAIRHWYGYGRHVYFHESEYNVRVDGKARGDSEVATEARIAELRSQGIVK